MINETICWSEELDHDGDWVYIFSGLLLLNKTILINIGLLYYSCKDKFELLYLKCFISLPVFLWTSSLSSLYIIVDPAVFTGCCSCWPVDLAVLAQLIGSKVVAR